MLNFIIGSLKFIFVEQVIERLYGELRLSLPVTWLKAAQFQTIMVDQHNRTFSPKTIYNVS